MPTARNILDVKITKGTSIFTASMNRTEFLQKSIPSWLKTDVKEIIIVDWSSDVPISRLISQFRDNRIKVISVKDQKHWILTVAFNIAARFTSHKKILKVDADTLLEPNFFDEHRLKKKTYFAGDWRNARTDNEKHTNGIVYVSRSNFFKVNGYNENIQTYGWDDCDLYDRLSSLGLERKSLVLDYVRHVEHDDILRLMHQRHDKNTLTRLDIEIERNRLLCQLPEKKWSSNNMMNSVQTITAAQNGYNVIINNKTTWDEGLMTDLLTKAKINRNYALSANRKTFNLFIEVKNGLGNRLRALASAFCIAVESKRNLHVIWEKSEHCGALINDLFDIDALKKLSQLNGIDITIYDSKLKALALLVGRNIENFVETLFYNFEEECNAIYYDYMTKDKNRVIDAGVRSDIYVSSASVLSSKSTTWNKECNFLSSLQPSRHVQRRIDKYTRLLKSRNASIESCIGVHVRMQQIESYENIEHYSTDAKESLLKWRAESHWSIFVKEMKEILKSNQSQKFFLCCSTKEAYDEISKVLGDNVIFIKRKIYDRSKRQVRGALVDAILLSRTSKMLGSNWSAFTELAQRLGNGKGEFVVRKAGVNF